MSEPVDLRLVPAAAAAWLAAAWGLDRGPHPPAVVAGMAAASAAALLAAAWPRAGRHRSAAAGGVQAGLGGAALACAAAAAVLASAAAAAAAVDASPVTAAAERAAVVRVVGVLVTEPRPAGWDDQDLTATVRVREIVLRGARLSADDVVVLRAGTGWAGLAAGSEISATGRLAAVEGRPDAVLTAGPPELTRAPGPVAALVARLRSGLRAAVADLPADARALVPGAAVGDTSQVDAELRAVMRTAGLSHLVAVSGQHVTVVVLAGLWLAGWLRAPRWGRAGVALAAALAFATLAGGGPSVLRAVATGAVGALALGLGRPARALPALAAVVVGILVADPWAVRSLGFQLSVAATAAIVVLARPAARALAAVARVPARVAEAITVPLAAQSAVGPILVLVDPVVAPWAVLANVLAAPAVVPATLLGLVATALGAVVPDAARVAAWAAAVPTGWVAAVARTVAGLPGAGLGWRPGLPGAIGLAALAAAAWWAGGLVAARRGR